LNLTGEQLKDYILELEPRGSLRFGIAQHRLNAEGFSVGYVDAIWWPKPHHKWVKMIRVETTRPMPEAARALRKVLDSVNDQDGGMPCDVWLWSSVYPRTLSWTVYL
jgi:hypothetical protein